MAAMNDEIDVKSFLPFVGKKSCFEISILDLDALRAPNFRFILLVNLKNSLQLT